MNIPLHRQRGMSIVELMVGVAVGLIVTAAATIMVANQLAESRRLLLETQVQQDLRATADVIVRDLRRAGYWANSHRGTAAGGALEGIIPNNPYADISPNVDDDVATEVTYAYASLTAADDNVITDPEQAGFRLSGEVIQSQLGKDNWQDLTDGGSLRVTQFNIKAEVESVPLACHRDCSAGGTVCPPQQLVRGITVEIAGEAKSDSAVKRTVRSHVRVRNDAIIGECRD